MSNLAYDIVEVQETSVDQAGTRRPKPFVVPDSGGDGRDPVARRIAEVLDFQLEQGAMPA